MTKIYRRSEQSEIVKLFNLFLAVLLLACVSTSVRAQDTAKTIQLLRPLNGATVRETVPISVSPADLPATGYFTVSIDKVFRTAEVITPGNSLLYVWDSQAPYQDPNNPGVDQYTDDGNHEIEVAVYDQQGTLLANGAATVKLANKVTNLPDGIKLSYAWTLDQVLLYKRHSELNELSTGTSVAAQNLETTDINFSRSVEDTTGGEYLVRDEVRPGGKIVSHGATSSIQSLFNLKSRYRTVNSYGETLVEETPFSTGDHLGFPIAQVPQRRITEGDSWDTKIEVSLPWATEKPTVLQGSARLDSFEWQDGYPTAKIIETYDGPAQLFANPKGTISFQADNIHLVRTYWFAYNSKRLVKSRTEMTIDANVTSDVNSALTSGSSSTGGSGMMSPQIQNPFGGDDGIGDGQQQTPGMNNGISATSTTPIKLQVLDDVTLVGV